MSNGCAAEPSGRRTLFETPVAKEKAKATWKTVFTGGSRIATVDGVKIWLSHPAVGPAKKAGQPAPVDKKAFIDPILFGRTMPLAQGRTLRVMLDPGHGGTDPGAVSKTLKEGDVTLDIAKRTADLLAKQGYSVRLTRTGNESVTLDRRTAMAEQWKADLFVSIHLNAAAAPSATGIETFLITPVGVKTTQQGDSGPPYVETPQKAYPGNAAHDENMRLAFSVHRRALAATAFTDRGIKTARFAVLRHATMPAILVECGFLSNPANAALHATPDGRARIASGLALGIRDYAHGAITPR
ncbi:MAG: N-acetylmuramoyl-L-alanine amidase [Kiritimatiellaeota bacterium]|nr:N-acetylmuramoyl-L-alanine amidase [Kiritimatiellota bacterium]